MYKDYEKLFARFAQPEPPENLFNKVMRRIRQEQRLSALKRRFAIFSFVMVCCIAAFIPTFKMAQTEFSESQFLQFLSLIFSDFGIVISQWQSFVLVLLESLPVVSIIALLSIIFTLLVSLKFLARDIKVVFASYGFQKYGFQ